MEQTVRGHGRINLLGRVQKVRGCGAWGHGVVVNTECWVNRLDDLSNLNDSLQGNEHTPATISLIVPVGVLNHVRFGCRGEACGAFVGTTILNFFF